MERNKKAKPPLSSPGLRKTICFTTPLHYLLLLLTWTLILSLLHAVHFNILIFYLHILELTLS